MSELSLWPRLLSQRRSKPSLRARPGIGADVDARGVHRALGRHEHHVDRHDRILGVLQIRRDCDRGEVVRVDQRLLQLQELVGRIELAFAPRRVALQERVRKLRIGVAHLAEAMARAGVPFEIDLGAVRRTHDLDAMLDQLRADVAVVGERRSDLLLAALVGAVVEPLSLLRLEALERGLHRFELRGVAADHDARLAHDHRLARLDAERRAILRRLGPLQLARGLAAVIAEGLQRLRGSARRPARTAGGPRSAKRRDLRISSARCSRAPIPACRLRRLRRRLRRARLAVGRRTAGTELRPGLFSR